MKYEKNFSKASYIISIQKNNLGNNIIEIKKVLNLCILVDMVVLNIFIINIIKNKLKLNITQNLS